jgi:hypothetical protein
VVSCGMLWSLVGGGMFKAPTRLALVGFASLSRTGLAFVGVTKNINNLISSSSITSCLSSDLDVLTDAVSLSLPSHPVLLERMWLNLPLATQTLASVQDSDLFERYSVNDSAYSHAAMGIGCPSCKRTLCNPSTSVNPALHLHISHSIWAQ